MLEDAAFKDGGMIQAVNAPVIGFMFPAFDDRSTNLYGALYFNKSVSDSREAFVEAVFATKTHMAANEEKSLFSAMLSSALGEECNIAVVKALQEQAATRVQMHKEAKVPDALMINRNDIESMLAAGGVSCEKINDLGDAFEETFGMESEVRLENIIETKKFSVETPDVSIKVSPDCATDVEVRNIGGVNFILIPARESVEVNGIKLYDTSAH